MPETFAPVTLQNDTGQKLNAAYFNRLETNLETFDDRITATENGGMTPVVVTYAATVTVNASLGGVFRIVATGNVLLSDITNGADGQQIILEVFASGADRTLSFTGGADAVSIPSGQWWAGRFRYNLGEDSWYLSEDYGPAPGMPLSIIDAKGDLVVGTANDTVTRLPVGTNGQVLTANAAAPSGIAWAVPPVSGRVIDPSAAPYSAPGTGGGDSTAGLTAALAALLPGDTLWIGPGKIYTHSTVQTVAADSVTIIGGGEIRATAENTSAFVITGNNVRIDNVKFTCPTTTARGETFSHHKLILNQCVGASLHKVTVDGSAGAGMFVYGASWYHIDACYVTNTRADAYHNVKGSHHGIITNCEALNVGDDGFAVVSYATGGDAGTTHHVRVSDCKVTNSTKGRMFSCAGGEDVEFSDCFGDGSYAAGIIASTEPAYASPGVARVIFRNMEIRRANTLVGPAGAPVRPDHGAILVTCARDGTTITDVTIRNVRIVDTDTAIATRQVAINTTGTGDVAGIVLEDIKVFGTGPATFFTTTVAASKYQLIDAKPNPVSWGWELLGQTKLAAPAATTGAVTIPARDELMILVRVAGMSGADVPALQFNADGGNNYRTRFITAAAGSVTFTDVPTLTTNMLRLSGISANGLRQFEATIGNHPAWEKSAILKASRTTAAAGTAPSIDVAGDGEWVNGAASITSVTLLTAGGATLNAASGFLVFGRNLG